MKLRSRLGSMLLKLFLRTRPGHQLFAKYFGILALEAFILEYFYGVSLIIHSVIVESLGTQILVLESLAPSLGRFVKDR